MAEIVLTTLNAKYIHAAFGLRYLMANLGPLRSRACIVEFDIHQRASDIVEVLLAQNPKIVGVGVYIWNATLSAEVVSMLKRVRPDVIVVLGGPEVSFEVEQQAIAEKADYVITGEADLKFPELCDQLLRGGRPPQKVIAAELPDLNKLALPYDLYDDRDVAHRVIYVEASRGCPFTCEFCLSSLDVPVRQFPLEPLLASLQRLLDRGVKQFKFVDRTFNLNLHVSQAMLRFFLERFHPGLFLHFEMIPDRLPEALRELITRFPPGALQFEVGIQTFNEEVSNRIARRQNVQRLTDNFHFLRNNTGVHIHADLIVGLPGEDLESFGRGFDQLVALRPQEIQVGILKRLRGTPIVRHDAEWEMVYGEQPPYEILRNKSLDFATMQRLRRFARYWDLIGNSGNFIETTPLLWKVSEPPETNSDSRSSRGHETLRSHIQDARPQTTKSESPHVACYESESSPFHGFVRFSDWLHSTVERKHGIALTELTELLFRYLTEELHQSPAEVAKVLWRDYQRGGRTDRPAFLREYIRAEVRRTRFAPTGSAPKRQARHLAAV